MKSLIRLHLQVLEELGTWCRTSTTQDVKTILSRFEHEGFSFLTITLPSFAKDFEKSLDQGKVDRNLFQGFSWKGGLPRFLGGFLDRVFDRGTGRLLDEPDILSIRAVRQICLMFSKILLDCSEERIKAAYDSYIQCESDVKQTDPFFSGPLKEDFERIGRLLWSEMFTRLDAKVYTGDVLPKHGPGATADRLMGNQKYGQLDWTERLERIFPMGRYVFPSWKFFLEFQDRVDIREPGRELPCRLTHVPKTLKTPRLIAIEPTAMQYMQQALMESIEEEFRADDNARNFVNYDSQEPNQLLARKGSIDGSLATLDMKEASDRVSNQHVRSLLARFPHLFEGVDACRSRKVDVPGHGVIRVAKFASMGSALCFPFEAMVFCTAIFVGIERELNRQLTKKDLRSFYGRVRVYGDDIIIPVDFVPSVIRVFDLLGLKTNLNKSFWTGKFRESCGKEFYDGAPVTVARVRRILPASREDALEIASAVSLWNQLNELGFTKVCDTLQEIIERFIPFPELSETSPGLGRHTGNRKVTRMHPHYQSPLVKAAVLRPILPNNSLEGYGALMKMFLRRGPDPFEDVNHLQRSGRPLSVDIKIRWVQPF